MTHNKSEVRVRFAPSPTGIPHVGNIRTALFNYFFAKSKGGEFLLRIEDTDQARKVEGAEEVIKESLEWLGVTWDEYIVQSQNLAEYKKAAELLIEKGVAREDDGAIRFTVPDEGETSWQDGVGSKTISFKNSEIEDFIILKRDGFPTYHLANVVDDHAENITHVIRGEDWISSAPKHILLYQAFGWNTPTFVHVPNIFGTDGKKLSKRRGAQSVLEFREQGFLPEALLNYLMLLGFSPKDNREILSKEDFEKEFALEKINTAPAIFDMNKLLWMNGSYLRDKTTEQVAKLLADFYASDDKVLDLINSDSGAKIIELAKTRINTLADFKNLVIQESYEMDENDDKITNDLKQDLGGLEQWNKDQIFDVFKNLMNKYQVKMPVFYRIFTGKKHGLPLPDFLEALGKQKSLDRI